MNKTGEISCGNLPDSAKAAAGRGKKMMAVCICVPLKLFPGKCLPLWCENSFVLRIMLSFGVYLEYPMSHQL